VLLHLVTAFARNVNSWVVKAIRIIRNVTPYIMIFFQ
jgi:hypothetical protein